jgi:predicted transposase YbfD/YdcC
VERHLETATTDTDTTHGHGHGREEYRELIVSTATSDDLGVTFPHINQVGRIIRDTILGDGSRRGESVHFITSLTADKATPSHIADLIRSHWRIENTSHWRRDVTLNEDRCRTRTAHSPINLAALRNLTIAIIAKHKPARFSRLRNAIAGSLPAILATLTLGPAVTLGFY